MLPRQKENGLTGENLMKSNLLHNPVQLAVRFDASAASQAHGNFQIHCE